MNRYKKRKGTNFIIDKLHWLDKDTPSSKKGKETNYKDTIRISETRVVPHKKEILGFVVKIKLQEKFLRILIVIMRMKVVDVAYVRMVNDNWMLYNYLNNLKYETILFYYFLKFT